MDNILKENSRITIRDRINENIKVNKNIPKNMKHIYKFKDNSKLNLKKVKNISLLFSRSAIILNPYLLFIININKRIYF